MGGGHGDVAHVPGGVFQSGLVVLDDLFGLVGESRAVEDGDHLDGGAGGVAFDEED